MANLGTVVISGIALAIASRSTIALRGAKANQSTNQWPNYMKKTIHSCLQVFACAGLLSAQGTPDDAKVLTTSQNPVGDLISVPFQNNVNFPVGKFSRIQNVLNIQPVVPIHMSNDWLVISRWITPVVYQPNLGPGCRSWGHAATVTCEFRERDSALEGGANGLGDLNPTFFLSPAHPGKLIWGFGPTFLLPTATAPPLGQGKWGAGPSIVLLVQPEHWTIGVLANNIWFFRRQPGTHPGKPVSDAVLRDEELRAWLVPHICADPHGELAHPRRQSVACAVRRRLWENDAVLRPAYGLADEYLLQRRPSTRPALSEIASTPGCDPVIPRPKMKSPETIR